MMIYDWTSGNGRGHLTNRKRKFGKLFFDAKLKYLQPLLRNKELFVYVSLQG